MEWKPIRTAQKDGQPILVCGGVEHGSMGSVDSPLTRPCVAEWYEGDESSTWFKSDDCYSTPVSPTHWRPLPPFDGKVGDKVVLPEPVTLPQKKTTMTEEEFIAEWKDIPKRFDFEICNFTKWSVLVDEAKLKLALSYGVKE